MRHDDRVQLKIYLHRAQRDALADEAASREVSVGTLVRQQITALTDVPDTLGRRSRKVKT